MLLFNYVHLSLTINLLVDLILQFCRYNSYGRKYNKILYIKITVYIFKDISYKIIKNIVFNTIVKANNSSFLHEYSDITLNMSRLGISKNNKTYIFFIHFYFIINFTY